MKKLLSYALALVLLVSVLAGIPNSEVFVVDAVSTATTDNPAPGQAVPAPSAVPAVSNTSAGTNRLLADGSFGEDVKLLQTMLNNNGYALKADGIFGKLTQAAVMDYQSKNSLVSDGIVGPKTLAKLVPAPAAPVAATPVAEEKPEVDAVTSASIVSDAAAFEKAISKDGKWIICTLNDLVIDKPLVLEGDFHDKNDPAKDLKRKIGLYTQDDDHNVLERFTLTASTLTVKSPNARIQGGTFKGDLYIYAKNFSLVDAKVDGTVYFATQEAKDTFILDEKSSITGKQILFDVDAVSSATPTQVQNIEAFEKAISKDGYWIIVPITDLETDKALVLEGEFHDKNDPAKDLKRKIGLYTHNNPENKKIATHSFTLKAPSLTIKSPRATLQYGYFVGDIYVEANDFSLVNNTVTGNIYFTTQEARDTFTMDAGSSVSGVLEVKAE